MCKLIKLNFDLVLSRVFGSFRITPACFRISVMGITKPILKITVNVSFQKCATHRVVSGDHLFQIKYRSEIQFLSYFIAHSSHFVNHIDFCLKTHCTLAGNGKGGCLRLEVVFSLGSPSQQ